MNEFVIDGRGTKALVSLNSRGPAAPALATFTVTVVPSGPSSLLETCCEFQPSVDSPFISTIWSPYRIPALYAGVPSNGDIMYTFPFRWAIVDPIPEYRLRCSFWKVCHSFLSRNDECGSSVCSIPCTDDLTTRSTSTWPA